MSVLTSIRCCARNSAPWSRSRIALLSTLSLSSRALKNEALQPAAQNSKDEPVGTYSTAQRRRPFLPRRGTWVAVDEEGSVNVTTRREALAADLVV